MKIRSRDLTEDDACSHDAVALGGLTDDFQYLECLSCGFKDYTMKRYIAARDAPE